MLTIYYSYFSLLESHFLNIFDGHSIRAKRSKGGLNRKALYVVQINKEWKKKILNFRLQAIDRR